MQAAGMRFLPLALFLLAGGVASVAMGPDANWDLRNYHLYAPFAWANPRPADNLPAGIQTLFNPLPDLPFLALISTFNDWPWVVCFAMGLPAGLSAFLLWRLALSVLPAGLAALATLGGVTGAAFISEIGTTFNDLTTAPLLLGALLLLGRGGVGWAGLLGGLAVGLKLTNAPFALGLAAAALAGPRPRLILLGAMGLLGTLAGAGPWMLHIWTETGNPIFPFADSLFATGDEAARVARDTRFLPDGPWQALSWPFRWAFSSAPLVSEVSMRDPRLAMGLLAVPWLLWRGGPGRGLALFFAVGFAGWYGGFGIYRYALVLECLAPTLVLLALRPLPRPWVVAPAAILLMLALTKPMVWGRGSREGQYLTASLPAVPPGSLVVISGVPAAYLAWVAPALRFAGLDEQAVLGRPARHMGRLRDDVAAGTPAYALVPNGADAASRFSAMGRPIQPQACRRVCTSWTAGGVGPALCPLEGSPVPDWGAANTLCAMAGPEFGLSGRRGLAVPLAGAGLLPPPGCNVLTLRTGPGQARLLAASAPAVVEGDATLIIQVTGPLRLIPGASGVWLRSARCGAATAGGK